MSKVKIAGHASGSGTLTIQAPDTSSSRTITLPDETGTLSVGSSIDDNGNATAITIDSSENVGIGTATPASRLHVDEGAADDCRIIAETHAGGDSMILFSQGSSGAGTPTWGVGLDAGGTGTDSLSIGFEDTGYDGFSLTSDNLFTITSDGRGLSQFTAKAWCNFDSTGTPAFRDSHNCSSITDHAEGDLSVNMTNALATANFSVVASGGVDTTNPSARNVAAVPVDTDTFRLEIYSTTGDTHEDLAYISAVVFGD